MDMWLPNQIELNETSRALVRDVDQAARRVDQQRPLPKEVLARIDERLLGERVYSSNAIEGNTLDLRETVMILEQGIGGFKKKREAQEAKNLGDAVRTVTAWIDQEGDCHSADQLRLVHGLILRSLDDEWAGRYRTHRVMISGAVHQPPDHAQVTPLMESVMKELRSPSHEDAFLRAVWAHWAIARIHPFHDGNGRIARLWQDIVLLQNHYTCAVIRPEDRREYMDALGHADEGQFNPLVQLVARRVSSAFDLYLMELRNREKDDGWLSEVVGEVDARSEQQRALSYVRWARQMEQLWREFEHCAASVSDASNDLGIQIRPYEVIDQDRWENIRSGVGADLASLFKIEFSHERKRCLYTFFLGRHIRTERDTDQDREQPRVCILINEDDGSGNAVPLDQIPDCPLETREIFLVDDALVRRREDHASTETVYDREISALKIAQDFIKEVVQRRMT